LAAVKNADLWQRLDRLLEIHAVECRPARKAADDLCPPPRPSHWRALQSGKRVRIDAGARKKSEEPKNQRTKRGRPRALVQFGSSLLRFFGF